MPTRMALPIIAQRTLPFVSVLHVHNTASSAPSVHKAQRGPTLVESNLDCSRQR